MDIISKEEFDGMMKKLEKTGLALSDKQVKMRQFWLDMKYIPPKYFESHTVNEICDQFGCVCIDEDIRKNMILYQQVLEANQKLIQAFKDGMKDMEEDG